MPVLLFSAKHEAKQQTANRFPFALHAPVQKNSEAYPAQFVCRSIALSRESLQTDREPRMKTDREYLREMQAIPLRDNPKLRALTPAVRATKYLQAYLAEDIPDRESLIVRLASDRQTVVCIDNVLNLALVDSRFDSYMREVNENIFQIAPTLREHEFFREYPNRLTCAQRKKI